MIERTCKCGNAFAVQHPSSKRLNCSAKCRGVKTKTRADAGLRKSEWVTRTCPCGQTFDVPKWTPPTRAATCSPECSYRFRRKPPGRKPARGSERYLTDEGYVRIYIPPGERPPGYTKTHVLEHRHVMATLLGRHLLPEENVHHRNGVKSDNRPSNLELWTTKQPKGQRALDLLAYAEEITALYGPVRQAL